MIVRGRQVLIKPVLKKESVIITSDKPELTDRANIVIFGNQVVGLSQGDSVLFNNRAGTPVNIDGEELILTDESNIYIVF